MHKHWKDAHPEMETRPAFRIEVVASFRDALSRQLSEAVRIELRGKGVLNSKAEYSRCRVPRLTINKDEWKSKVEDPGKEKEGAKDGEILQEMCAGGMEVKGVDPPWRTGWRVTRTRSRITSPPWKPPREQRR